MAHKAVEDADALRSAATYIDQGLCWMDTEEGAEYWSEVYSLLREYAESEDEEEEKEEEKDPVLEELREL